MTDILPTASARGPSSTPVAGGGPLSSDVAPNSPGADLQVCPNGHPIGPGGLFCGQCGVALPTDRPVALTQPGVAVVGDGGEDGTREAYVPLDNVTPLQSPAGRSHRKRRVAVVAGVTAILLVGGVAAAAGTHGSKAARAPVSLQSRCASELEDVLRSAEAQGTFSAGLTYIFHVYGSASNVSHMLVQIEARFQAQAVQYGTERASALARQSIGTTCQTLVASNQYPIDHSLPPIAGGQ